MVKVKIYSLPECPFCKKAKAYFKANNIEYEDVNVDDEKAQKEMEEISGQRSVPVIVIKKNHSVGVIVGFEREKLDGVLKG